MMSRPDDPSDARSLPDEYARLRTRSAERVLELVGSRWSDLPEGECRELAQVLMTILEPLNRPGAKVTEELRIACEQVVTEWVHGAAAHGELVEGAARRPVAHAATAPEAMGRRIVRLGGAEATEFGNGRCTARVTLERSGRRHTAMAGCRVETMEQLRGGAQATLEALRLAVPESPLRLSLGDLGTFEAFDRMGVIVSVAVLEADQRSTLVGVCPDVASQPVRAAALAVLNATNRRLGTG